MLRIPLGQSLTFSFPRCTIRGIMSINVRRTRSRRPNPKLSHQIGHRIQQLREEKGWTQRQLAAHLGISRSSLSNYESGDREITLPTLMRTAQLFGIPVDFLLPGAGSVPLEHELYGRLRRVLALQDRGKAVLILDTLLSMCGFLQASRPEAVRSGEGR
jgi:transcriptional regulator with XRE-family HTH domain